MERELVVETWQLMLLIFVMVSLLACAGELLRMRGK